MIHRHSKRSADKARRGGKLKIDGVGIALIALASAALEIVLDRGQIDDWFGSPVISWLFAIAIIGGGLALYWELKVDDPIIDLRLLRYPSFAVSSVFYFTSVLDCLRRRR